MFLLITFKKVWINTKKSLTIVNDIIILFTKQDKLKILTMAKITIAAKIEQEDKNEIDKLAKEQMRTTSNMIEVIIRKGLQAIRQEKQKAV